MNTKILLATLNAALPTWGARYVPSEDDSLDDMIDFEFQPSLHVQLHADGTFCVVREDADGCFIFSRPTASAIVVVEQLTKQQ